MNRLLSLFLSIAIAFSLTACAHTQKAAVQPVQLEAPSRIGAVFAQSLNSACPRLAAQVLNSPEMADVLRDRPISNVSSVCECTDAALKNDQRLQNYLNAGEALSEERIKSKPFLAYVTARLTHAMFSCFITELGAALEASSFDK